MEDMKSKVLKFVKNKAVIHKENSSQDLEESELLRKNYQPIQRDFILTEDVEDESQVEEDEKILEEVDNIYFDIGIVDIKRFQLNKLPDVLSCKELRSELRLLYRQHSVVSKKLLRLILENEKKSKQESEHIFKINDEVSLALGYCKEGRSHLQLASKQCTISSLEILANHKRKLKIFDILKSLRTLKTLKETDKRLQELLQEKNYPGAINLLLECQLVASHFNHFKCVDQLSVKLSEILYMTKEQLNLALADICKQFNLETYSKLQEAYLLLDDCETVMDQLLMHFTSEIHNCVYQAVVEYSKPHSNVKVEFQQLCRSVPSTNFIPCLQSICRQLWAILRSYHQVVSWHQMRNKDFIKTDNPSEDVKLSLTRQHVKQKLENGLIRLWDDVQSKVCVCVTSRQLNDFKFEEILQILSIIHKLIEIGDEFASSKSDALQNSIRQATVNYFKNYHFSKLEEMKIFLENESWTLCPVRKTFNLLQLQEFRPLRKSIEICKKRKESEQDDRLEQNSATTSVDDCSSQNTPLFSKYQEGNDTPFDVINYESTEENILNDFEDMSGYYTVSSDDSECEELKREFVEEAPSQTLKKKKHVKKEKCPLVANTSITLLRQCGKYLQMSKLLRPIAVDVVLGMCQLYEFYFFTIYTFFTRDLPVQSATMFSDKLQSTLHKIKEELIYEEGEQPVKTKMLPCTLFTGVELSSSETMFGLMERMIGVESLIFIGNQLQLIQPYVLSQIPEKKRHFINQFYTQIVDCSKDLRRPAYMTVSANVIDMKFIIEEMSKVNFEIGELMSQHSAYVDKVLRELQVFAMKLEEYDVSTEVYSALWEDVIHIINNIFVEGFSNSKKCSYEGRALMQLDYIQFLSKLEKITTLKQIPNREYVDMYVKAYYLQETELENWILQHREYTPKQLKALVICACQNNKNRRKRLLNLLGGSENL